jgi:hypothetical protein
MLSDTYVVFLKKRTNAVRHLVKRPASSAACWACVFTNSDQFKSIDHAVVFIGRCDRYDFIETNVIE